MEKKRRARVQERLRDKPVALKQVIGGVRIDDQDGFVRVKGTRKRQCAGIDLEPGRARRSYKQVLSVVILCRICADGYHYNRWKNGKGPQRNSTKDVS